MSAYAITVLKEHIVTPLSSIAHLLIKTDDKSSADIELEPHENHISLVDTWDRNIINVSLDQLPVLIASLTKLEEYYNGTSTASKG